MKALKDIELKSHLEAAALGLDREADLVTGPHNVLGLELNPYAAELARMTVWIGELQWRMAHGYAFKTNPVLEPLDHIECRDALLAWPDFPAHWHGLPATQNPVRPEPVEGSKGNEGFDKLSPNGYRVQSVPLGSDHDVAQQNTCAAPVGGAVCEAAWPRADIVIGNPPFLGDRKMIRELGEAYTATLRQVYQGRVPGGADLVTYWFEKARAHIETGQCQRAGLVATNSIRGGANQIVLTGCDSK